MITPQEVMERLQAIEEDLAVRQNTLESAAMNWHIAKRDREKARAVAFLDAKGKTVAERSAEADKLTATDGKREEAEWVALKAVVDVLQTRASIGQSLLRAQGQV